MKGIVLNCFRVVNERYLVLSLGMFLLMTTAFADDETLDTRYAKFLASLLPQDNIECAYTRTYSLKDSGVEVEHYSPDTQWRLVTVNGEEPSESELEDYVNEADERIRRRTHPSDLDFLTSTVSDIVEMNQLNPETVEFVFKPEMGGEFGEELSDKLSGRMTVAKDGMRPLNFVITLNDRVSPMPMVKIRVFEQKVTFVEDQATGATLIKSMSFNVQGRAFLVKRIMQVEQVDFSDFDCRVIATEPTEL